MRAKKHESKELCRGRSLEIPCESLTKGTIQRESTKSTKGLQIATATGLIAEQRHYNLDSIGGTFDFQSQRVEKPFLDIQVKLGGRTIP